MDFCTILLSSEEPLERTKEKYRDTWPISVLWLQDLIISWLIQQTDSDKNLKNKSKKDL